MFRYQGISLGELAQLEVFLKLRPGTESNTNRWVQFLKDRGYAWQVRFSFGRAMPAPPIKQVADGLVLFDVRNRPAIQTMNAVARELQDQGQQIACVLSDPAMRRFLARELSGFSYSKFFGREQANKTREAWKLIKAELRSSEDQIYRYLTASDLVSRETARGIVAFLYPYFHQAIRDVATFGNLAANLGPKYFVVATDSHKLGRLVARLGSTSNWTTTVVQHGMPGLQFAYVPVYADRIAVWGDESARWFEERGVPRSKIFISGNPRYDSYKAAFCNEDGRPSKIIVIGTTAAEDNLSMTKMVAAAASDFDLKIFFKPHPSHGQLSYLNSAGTDKYEGITILPADKPMQDIVKPCDIVVLTNSSAGVDALILGGQLIVARLPGNRAKASYHKLGSLIKWAACADEMKRVISEYLCAGADKQAAVQGIKEYLHSTLGDLQGNSTRRLAEFIISTGSHHSRCS